ncbi:MAG: PSD1 and planctomycete cytochrome C domain-containing protein [Planctomycetaceae bacterium]
MFIALVMFSPAASRAGDTPAKPSASDIEFFERSVRPVLAESCFKCHGTAKQESGLRLDSRASLLKGGDNGPAADLKRPLASLFIKAVRREDGLEMPPEHPLDQAKTSALIRWAELGFPWPEEKNSSASNGNNLRSHWAFQPVRAIELPDVLNRSWPLTPIDRFILARLEKAGLSPSPFADRRTLARRVSFDLLGLPPSPEDISAFETDTSADAYEKMIDRFLASPHYGERWGRYWLDVARYADNKGYVFFEDGSFPWAYTYRDYVIESLNADLPYDRFIIEQIAADKLVKEPGTDRSSLRALGFLTVGGHFMNNVHDIIDDRIDVVTRGLMGFTVTCARCHDHKFDPIPQDDYYSLYGVFSASEEPILPPLFTGEPGTDEYRKFSAEMQSREKKLNDFASTTIDHIVRDARSRVAEYLLAAYAMRNQPNTEDFMLLADKGDLNPTIITRWRNYLEKAALRDDPVWTIWTAYAKLKDEEFATKAPEVAVKYSVVGGALEQTANRLVRRALSGDAPATMADVTRRYTELLQSIDRKWTDLQNAPRPEGVAAPTRLPDDAEEELRQVFYGPDGPPNIPRVIGWGFLTLLPDRPSQEEYKKLLKDVESWSMTGPGAPARAMVLVDSPITDPVRVFQRGNPNRLGKEVPRAFPTALGKREPFREGSGRLELARAIVSPDNPLTARVLANRVWLHHFGAGLVATAGDFGLRGDSPSHPELLDFLANELIRNGWSLKSLHRQILLSAAYQQSSAERDDATRIDSENRLLSRMNRRRLDFEAMRDMLLSASGSLDTELGGTAVDLQSAPVVARRTVYGSVDRLNLPGLYTVFDFPSPLASSPSRDTTTIPPQSLFFMNSPFAIECGKRLAQRSDVITIAATDERLARVYSLLFGRAPSSKESELAHEFLGPDPKNENWISFAQALLMTNELMFID